MMYIVALILVILFLCNNPRAKTEAYELFGGSGFRRTKPISRHVGSMITPEGEVEEKVTNATPDLIQTLVRATMSGFPDDCLFPIETNSINKLGSNYKCSFTFVRQDTGSEEHTSELQSRFDLVCRLLLEKNTRSPS